jgi:hypothetical protein
MKKENLTISEIQDLVKKVISEKSEPKKELRDAYEKLKKVRKELKERGKNNSDLKKYKTTMRELADEIEEMEDEEKVEMEEGANDEVIEKNEQSEGYGTFKGLGMNENRRVIKLKESDLKRVIQRVVKESGKFTSKRKVKPLKEQDSVKVYGMDYILDMYDKVVADNIINSLEEGIDLVDQEDNFSFYKIPKYIIDNRIPTALKNGREYISDELNRMPEYPVVNESKKKSLTEAPEKDTYWVISKADRENLLKMGGEAEVIGKSATNDFSKYCR